MSSTEKYSYAEEEIHSIYDLVILSIEAGEIQRAMILAQGLCVIAPKFAPAFLVLSYVHCLNSEFQDAYEASTKAYRLASEDPSVALFFATTALMVGDAQSAGTVLGEVGEMIEGNVLTSPNITRLFKLQLARFQTRTK